MVYKSAKAVSRHSKDGEKGNAGATGADWGDCACLKYSLILLNVLLRIFNEEAGFEETIEDIAEIKSSGHNLNISGITHFELLLGYYLYGKSNDFFESDGECLVEIWNIKTGKGVARFVSKDEMRELLRKGKVKEFVMSLIKEVPSHGAGEAMLPNGPSGLYTQVFLAAASSTPPW